MSVGRSALSVRPNRSRTEKGDPLSDRPFLPRRPHRISPSLSPVLTLRVHTSTFYTKDERSPEPIFPCCLNRFQQKAQTENLRIHQVRRVLGELGPVCHFFSTVADSIVSPTEENALRIRFEYQLRTTKCCIAPCWLTGIYTTHDALAAI